jgi:hypothetical protein
MQLPINMRIYDDTEILNSWYKIMIVIRKFRYFFYRNRELVGIAKMSKESAILPQLLRVSASLSLLGALNAARAVRFDHQDVRLAVYLALHTQCARG